MTTAASSVSERSVGKIGAKRASVPQSPSSVSLTVPVGINAFVCRNDGANDIKVNFDTDTGSNFWTLKPGESIPTAIIIKDSVTINATAVGGTSTIEAIFWG